MSSPRGLIPTVTIPGGPLVVAVVLAVVLGQVPMLLGALTFLAVATGVGAYVYRQSVRCSVRRERAVKARRDRSVQNRAWIDELVLMDERPGLPAIDPTVSLALPVERDELYSSDWLAGDVIENGGAAA